MSSAIVVAIAAMPGMAQQLLATHTDDGTGRCVVCSGGAQSGRYVWPCTLCTIARQAMRYLRVSAPDVPSTASSDRSEARAISA